MPNRATRQKLASAALRLFRDRGFDRVSVEEIAAAAGVSRRTFFRHFASKDAVVFAAHGRRVDALEQAISERSDLAPTAAIRAACLELARGYQEESSAHLAEWSIVQSSSSLVARELELDRDFEDVIARGLARGPISMDHRLVAGILMGAIRVALRLWLEAGAEDALEQLGDRAFDLALGGVAVIDGEGARSVPPQIPATGAQ